MLKILLLLFPTWHGSQWDPQTGSLLTGIEGVTLGALNVKGKVRAKKCFKDQPKYLLFHFCLGCTESTSGKFLMTAGLLAYWDLMFEVWRGQSNEVLKRLDLLLLTLSVTVAMDPSAIAHQSRFGGETWFWVGLVILLRLKTERRVWCPYSQTIHGLQAEVGAS